MNFDKVKSILNTLDNKQKELCKLLDIENKITGRTWYLVDTENVQLEFSRSEFTKILEEKKRSLEGEIRDLAKELSKVNYD